MTEREYPIFPTPHQGNLFANPTVNTISSAILISFPTSMVWEPARQPSRLSIVSRHLYVLSDPCTGNVFHNHSLSISVSNHFPLSDPLLQATSPQRIPPNSATCANDLSVPLPGCAPRQSVIQDSGAFCDGPFPSPYWGLYLGNIDSSIQNTLCIKLSVPLLGWCLGNFARKWALYPAQPSFPSPH